MAKSTTPAKTPKKVELKQDQEPLVKTEKKKKPPKSLLAEVKNLIKVGKKRGYLSQDEILDVFVEPEIYISFWMIFMINFFKKTLTFLNLFLKSN